ncbi:MAG: ArnT family glycosyltransferase, partial [Candidatus Bathyarchaeia archaeon]
MFAFVYGALLLLNISYNSIMWDEVTHLTGGMYLLRGDFSRYFAFNAFYPPMFDLFTVGFFSVGGITVFSGRLVSVVFSLLSLYAVFEFTYRLYEPKIGLLASVFLAIMPGFVWLSRLAMIETMLIFFFTLSVLFFFIWLQNGKTTFLLLSGLTLGVGVLTKYQVIIGLAIMLTGLVVLGRDHLKRKLARLPLMLLITCAVVVPWIAASYQLYASGMLDAWFYAATIGNPDKSLYSLGLNSAGGNRLPHFYIEIPSWLQLPIFYFLEMTEPYFNVHPVSLFPYLLGLGGLVMFAWRRKTVDKYLLLWFFIVYVFFTLIPNRHWRYVVPLFPVLAISAA